MNLSPEEKIVLKNLVDAGGTGNVLEFLNYTSSDFDKGFECANEMQNKDLIKLLYSNFNKNLIVAELTLVGFEEGKK